jgi:hypothetical protein
MIRKLWEKNWNNNDKNDIFISFVDTTLLITKLGYNPDFLTPLRHLLYIYINVNKFATIVIIIKMLEIFLKFCKIDKHTEEVDPLIDDQRSLFNDCWFKAS